MKEKISLLNDLIQLMKVDGELKKTEYNFIVEIARQIGIGKTHLDSLFEQEIEFNPEKHEFDRIIQFHRLVLLMNFDKETHEKEMRMVRELAIRMGLNSLATEKVLKEMNNYPNKMMPPERLIQIFKENYN